ncbi:S-layer homology domain-containing protein [Desulfotomaculum copahuensis]|uniref:SLH domain-containing protein n=1 Tax=Desulfotomaculum copahuensis TaxID=1838280 RepID=A0A1B7LCA6_9FIRM|nr:S-layer homology domain-containing protein [Desulfotomaculum copahuensis]OAT80343.1 hypothetical protein A6M21_13715 [Desulfotomaculum copahuensis]
MKRLLYHFVVFCLAFVFLAAPAAFAQPGPPPGHFTDINGYWAQSQIVRLAALNIFRGFPDGTFRPENPVTQLEAVVLIVRAGDFKTGPPPRTGAAGGGGQWPKVPWGQYDFNLAAEKQFIPADLLNAFSPDKPITRAQLAAILTRAFYLPRPGVAAPPPGAGTAPAWPAFKDLEQAPAAYRADIQAAAAAGVMTGYPGDTFRPNQPLTRAEMAAALSTLLDLGWVKVPPGRLLTGWVSRLTSGHGRQEMELTSLTGVQKFQLPDGAQFFADGKVSAAAGALNHQVEVVLNGSRQPAFINILQARSNPAPDSWYRASVKSVDLGKDNLLVVNDLNCVDHILHLSSGAVVEGRNVRQGFKSLREGDFVNVYLSGEKVVKVDLLETKTAGGTVGSIINGRLYLQGVKASAGRPAWFNHYDYARLVDKDGVRTGGVNPGDQVQVTYLDPDPKGIDDEIPLQIKVLSTARQH